jgi:hypothetical protein
MDKKTRNLNTTETTSVVFDDGIESLTASIETLLRKMEIEEMRRSPNSLRSKSRLERLIGKVARDRSFNLPSITNKCQRKPGDDPSGK